MTKISVYMTEYKFRLSRSRAPVGTVVFTVYNKGKIVHNMKFLGPVVFAGTPTVQSGKKFVFRAKFRKPGAYGFVCTFHTQLGMTGTLRIVKAS